MERKGKDGLATLKPSDDQRVRSAYRNGDYKLTNEELRETLIKRGTVKDKADADDLIKNIRLYSTLQVIKDKKKIARLAQIGQYDMSSLSFFPESVQEEINQAIVERANEVQRKKNIKYLLPVEYVDYKNKEEYRVNPMIFRSSFSIKH